MRPFVFGYRMFVGLGVATAVTLVPNIRMVIHDPEL